LALQTEKRALTETSIHVAAIAALLAACPPEAAPFAAMHQLLLPDVQCRQHHQQQRPPLAVSQVSLECLVHLLLCVLYECLHGDGVLGAEHAHSKHTHQGPWDQHDKVA
jgi:hypothetical protein